MKKIETEREFLERTIGYLTDDHIPDYKKHGYREAIKTVIFGIITAIGFAGVKSSWRNIGRYEGDIAVTENEIKMMKSRIDFLKEQENKE